MKNFYVRENPIMGGNPRWYIACYNEDDSVGYLWSDLTINTSTGYQQYGKSTPGYYKTKEIAADCLARYLDSLKPATMICPESKNCKLVGCKHKEPHLFGSTWVDCTVRCNATGKRCSCVPYQEKKMEKLKIGDRVNIKDGSGIFGIQRGEYKTHCCHDNGDRYNLLVIATDLKLEQHKTHGNWAYVNDLLLTDGKNSFWFTQSNFVELIEPAILELTVAEVSRRLGQEVKIVKEKA